MALFLSDLPFGGAERAMVTLLHGLVGRVARLDLVLVRRQGALLADVPAAVNVVELGKGSRVELLSLLARLRRHQTIGVGARRLLLGRLPGAARALPRLLAYLARARPDALLTTLAENNIVGLWAAALARHPIRAVVREANTLSVEVAAGRRSTDDVLPALVRAWYPRADAVVAVSQGVAMDLERVLQPARAAIQVIPNGVDVAAIRSRAAAAIDEPWLIGDGPPVVLAVGRLQPQKDYPTLLRATARVRMHREVRLVILGEGGDRPMLEALARELGIARDLYLPGESGQAHAAMARAALLVSSSRFEGFPNVLAEALACGCPVVATDCPSGPREILGDGRFGRLVPVGDDAALAQAILATLAAPREPKLLVARAGDFGVERCADAYLAALLPDLAARPHGASPLLA